MKPIPKLTMTLDSFVQISGGYFMVQINGLPISYPAAPTGSRSGKTIRSGTALCNPYCSGNYVTFHRYYDGREFSGLENR